jgi:SWI/SNF-related matrix-associated actin-dependent regulator of chromatin subfamily A member 5
MLDEQLGKQAAGKNKKKAKSVILHVFQNQRLTCSDNRHRKSEKEEDEELLNESKEDEEEPYVFEESAPCTSLSQP